MSIVSGRWHNHIGVTVGGGSGLMTSVMLQRIFGYVSRVASQDEVMQEIAHMFHSGTS